MREVQRWIRAVLPCMPRLTSNRVAMDVSPGVDIASAGVLTDCGQLIQGSRV